MLRWKFLIKPKLQIKYMLITLFVVVLSALVVYVVLDQVLRSAGGMEQLTAGEWRKLEAALNRSLYLIVGFIAVVLAVESIFFFHRMVGPVYVFEKLLRTIKAGDLTQMMHLRKGDEFKEIAFEYNEMLKSLSEKIITIKSLTQKLYWYEDKLSPEARADFKKHLEELKNTIEYFKV